jgi:hypothetical protein
MAEPTQVRDLLPEDAYDGDDPFDIRLSVAERAVESWVDDNAEGRDQRLVGLLRLLDKLQDEIQQGLDRLTVARSKMRD